jgi:hypothetical protein
MHIPAVFDSRPKRSLATSMLALALVAAPALSAGTTFFQGDLRNNANVTSCGFGCTLAPGDSDGTWAQFAAFAVTFAVPADSFMHAVTFGYGGGTSGTGAVVAAGGLEPYLSLFDASGNFLFSTAFGVYCPPGANTVPGGTFGGCNDVLLDAGILPQGNYTIALSAFDNLSSAENVGGTFADGFTGLGNLSKGENLNYAFDIVLNEVPEPATAWLMLAALVAALARYRLFAFKHRRDQI